MGQKDFGNRQLGLKGLWNCVTKHLDSSMRTFRGPKDIEKVLSQMGLGLPKWALRMGLTQSSVVVLFARFVINVNLPEL